MPKNPTKKLPKIISTNKTHFLFTDPRIDGTPEKK